LLVGDYAVTKLNAIIVLLLISLQTLSTYSQDNFFMVHDRYDIPMVFVPSGIAHIGATLDEAVAKCEEVGTENGTARVEFCRQGLAHSVPDGVDYLVTPVDEVFLDDYFIDQYEVTIEAYQACVDANVCNDGVLEYLAGFSPYESLDEPVRYISYLDAEVYCEWRGGYIPSEAEWEYAARGLERFAFPWGNEFDGSIVNFCDINCTVPILRHELWDDGFASFAPVTAHPQDRSWVGAVGMAGNVSEWTSTTYTSELDSHSSSIRRVVKGGFFYSSPDHVLLWKRVPFVESEIREGIGFRCAKRL
jgi:formylglycine-generating enzyme required for sulfatase activity